MFTNVPRQIPAPVLNHRGARPAQRPARNAAPAADEGAMSRELAASLLGLPATASDAQLVEAVAAAEFKLAETETAPEGSFRARVAAQLGMPANSTVNALLDEVSARKAQADADREVDALYELAFGRAM